MAHGSLPSGDYTSIGWRSVHYREPDETNRSVDIPRGVARAQMKASLSGETRLVIVGATGMVGGYALRYALGHSAVKCVTAIVRRKLDLSHPKLNEVIHRDFADCSALAEVHAAIFCLGAYIVGAGVHALTTYRRWWM